MRHRIIRATARSNYTIEIAWEDGSESRLDFAPIIAAGPVFERLRRDVAYFVERMTIKDDGRVLGWSDEIDFSADGLWCKAHPGAAAAAE